MAERGTTRRTARAAARPADDRDEDRFDDDRPEDRTPSDGVPEPDDDLFDDDGDDGDDDQEDEFDDARSGFVKMDDIEDRLVLVYAHEIGQRESNLRGQQGKLYDYVVTTTHVLSGPTTDLLSEIPNVLEDFQMTGVNIVSQLKPKIRTRRPLLGVLTKRPPQQKGYNDAWFIEPASDRQKEIARRYMRKLRQRQGDPFDGS